MFIGLFAKLLQAYPGSLAPTVPTGGYPGDDLAFAGVREAWAAFDTATGGYPGDDLAFAAVPSTGKVTVTASAANAIVTTTEILAYRLPSPNAVVDPAQMRTLQFHRFVAGGLSTDVAVSAGTWAFA